MDENQFTVEVESSKRYIERLEKGNQNQRAAVMILDGAIDAPHHRQWYLDQALRILVGAEYRRLVMAWEQLSGEEWDAGIAP